MNAATPTPPRQVVFDPTPEIFATDTAGSFTFPLLVAGKAFLGTSAYDEVRFVFSIWHPSGQRTIDLDRAYVELRSSFDPDDEHWTKIAEIEPGVPPYAGGQRLRARGPPPDPGERLLRSLGHRKPRRSSRFQSSKVSSSQRATTT